MRVKTAIWGIWCLVVLTATPAFAQLREGLSYHDAIDRVASGEAAEVLHTVGSFSGIKVQIGFDEEDASAAERTFAGTLSTAEITAAILLRNNPKANAPLSTLSESALEGTNASRILGPDGRPMAGTGSAAQTTTRRLLSEVSETVGTRALTSAEELTSGMLGRAGVSTEAVAATRWGRFLGRVRGGRAGLAAFLLQLGASTRTWGPKFSEAFRSGSRLASYGQKLGGAGRYSTRQILYAHGAYNAWVATTGKKVRVEVGFEEEPEAAPSGSPGEAPAARTEPTLSEAELEALSESVEADLLGVEPVLERLERLLEEPGGAPPECDP
jgi:hypothetical protein